MISVLLLASLVALGAPETPAPGPTPAPTATTSPTTIDNLPEIGRVRAVAPACGVLRDLVIPSFLAARRADGHFAEAAKKLPDYVRVIDDDDRNFGAQRSMLLSRMGQQVSLMQQETLNINKALGDPRFNSSDPQVQAEKQKLTYIYNVQAERTARLFEYVTREQISDARAGFASGSATPPPSPTPVPFASTPPIGQPILHGIAIQDEQAMRDWTGGIDTSIRYVENLGAKTFIDVANGCK